MHSDRIALREPEPSDTGYRWVMLAGLWIGYAGFGLVAFSVAPLIKPMSEDFGLSRAAMGSVLGAWPLVYIAAAIPAGVIVDRFGLRRSLTAGIFLIALSGGLRAVSVDYVTLFVAVGIFGLGGPLVSVGAPKLVNVWFSEKERGLAMGIYMTGPSIGSIVALATANSLLMPLTGSSWRLTIGIYAAAALLTGVIWSLLAREPNRSSESIPETAPTISSVLMSFPQLLRIRVVQIIMLVGFSSFLYAHGFSNWLPEILRSKGMGSAEAGYWATIPTAIGIASSLTIPRLATPGRRIPILIGLFLAGGVGPLLIGTMEGVPLALGLLLQGARVSVIPVALLILMDAPQVGSDNMGAAGGLYFTAGQTGGVLGPLLMGILADLTGGFLSGLIMLAGISIALTSLTLGLRLAQQSDAERPAVAST